MSNDTQLAQAAAVLKQAKAVAVLTGAGISAESGVPTFRGPEGLWRKFRPEQLATPEAFARDPALVWEWYRWRRGRMAAVKPNPGHDAIARLEARFPSFTVITQNVDGLHAAAGTRRLIELHGSIWRDRCANNPSHRFDRQRDVTDGPLDALPHCDCGGLLRPDVVWFGEALDPADLEAAVEAARATQLFLVVGTSSLVYPAAGLPSIASQTGAVVVEINPEETALSAKADIVLRGPSGIVLPDLERLAF